MNIHLDIKLFFFTCQVNRPISMKKEGIQTRKRKAKSAKRSRSKGVTQVQENTGSDGKWSSFF